LYGVWSGTRNGFFYNCGACMEGAEAKIIKQHNKLNRISKNIHTTRNTADAEGLGNVP